MPYYIYNFAFSLTSSLVLVLESALALSLSTLLKIFPLADLGIVLRNAVVSISSEHTMLNRRPKHSHFRDGHCG